MQRPLLAALALLVGAGPLQAQAIKDQPPARRFAEAEVAAVAMPDLAFRESPADVLAYDKYFYFNRAGTSFDEAFADLTECDALASGISFYMGGGSEPYPGYYAQNYGVGGAIGAPIGAALGLALRDAIFGSAHRREVRRLNMRNCMGFKGYQRYGIAKDKWDSFNFEEGGGREKEERRQRAMLMQARVASGPVPRQQAIAP